MLAISPLGITLQAVGYDESWAKGSRGMLLAAAFETSLKEDKRHDHTCEEGLWRFDG